MGNQHLVLTFHKCDVITFSWLLCGVQPGSLEAYLHVLLLTLVEVL